MVKKSPGNIQKAVRLPLFCNRQDVRLYHNRLLPPLLRSRWRWHYKV